MMQLAVRLLTRYSQVNWALVDQTMVSGVNFLTGILLARYLGISERIAARFGRAMAPGGGQASGILTEIRSLRR